VSPPNIMVTGDGTVKLLDFGIAKARGVNSRTRTGTVKGKNAYMSPEQILGKPLDRRSDVFALAIVMYEMLAIKRLFHRDSDFLTFKAITEEPIPEIRDRRPDLPPGMRAALMQAMARDPNGRFDTAQAFGNAIRNSVSTIGGPASGADLSRLLFTDFSEEMSSRDEIIKAADDAPVPSTPPPFPRKPPTRPPPIPQSRSGELAELARDRLSGDNLASIPSMIVQSGSSKVEIPVPSGMNGSAVLELPLPVDTWMATPDTDLLKAHRWKSLVIGMAAVFGLILVIAVAVMIYLFTKTDEPDRPNVAPPPPDAYVVAKPPPDAMEGDGGMSKDDIVAISRWGFFSLNASQKTTIYIDNQKIGETPLTRLPVNPGPHKVRAVGPKGKTKEFKITIYGGRDTEAEFITW
jgi:serine/threonine-protein kinase